MSQCNHQCPPITDPLICHYCGCQIFLRGKLNSRTRPGATLDHVIPKSRAKGDGTGVTKVWCCMICNQLKGCLTIEEYRVVMAFRYGWITTEFKFPGEQHGQAEAT